MKPFSQLLSGLLITSVALLNSGAAWSDTQPNKRQAKSSTDATPKKAKVALKKVRKLQLKAITTLNMVKVPEIKTESTAQAPDSTVQLAVAENFNLPGSTAAVVAKLNPYLSGAAAATTSAANPYVLAAVPFTPVATAAPTTAAPVKAAAAAVSPAWVAAVQAPPQNAASTARPAGNPYLVNSMAFSPAPSIAGMAGMTNPSSAGLGQVFNDLRAFLPEPHLPSPDIDILPSITKVYPTGERPLYVLTFKCPTELVGITPPPTKALRWLISSGMEAVNSTNLLSFSMQQVCQ